MWLMYSAFTCVFFQVDFSLILNTYMKTCLLFSRVVVKCVWAFPTCFFGIFHDMSIWAIYVGLFLMSSWFKHVKPNLWVILSQAARRAYVFFSCTYTCHVYPSYIMHHHTWFFHLFIHRIYGIMCRYMETHIQIRTHIYIYILYIYTMWGPPVISWFISPSNYSYKYYKP